MSPYALAVFSLLLAAVAHTSAAWVAVERFLAQGEDKRRQRNWMILALTNALLCLQHGYTLELALRTGIYDFRQAMLAGLVALCLAFYCFRQR